MEKGGKPPTDQAEKVPTGGHLALDRHPRVRSLFPLDKLCPLGTGQPPREVLDVFHPAPDMLGGFRGLCS